MLLSSEQVAALLQSLGLTAAILKPIPDLVGNLTAPLHAIGDAADGILGSLPIPLPKLGDLPIIGDILEAEPGSSGIDAGHNSAMKDAQGAASPPCAVEPYNPPSILSQTFPPFDQAKANVFRYRQQQGVNLGSWFVHEQWMTPSVFTCASGPQSAEIDIATGWGNTSTARAVLERHWDTFINQSDFQYLASIGINTVRLPIGYWSLGPVYCKGTPFEPVADVYTNSWTRVVRAINWAGEAGIGVLIDLHGAPGSQNGQAHSGISDGQARLFGNETYERMTVEVLTYLTQQLASVTNVIGIELINEPNNDPGLADFFTSTIQTLRQISTEAAMFPFYIHDAFNIGQYSSYIANRTDFVVEDHHSYFVFTDTDTSRDAAQDTSNVETSVAGQLASSSAEERRNIIVGEWSCALVDSALKDQSDPMNARQRFCQGQEQVYSNTTAGWTFWSYMKEGCGTDFNWCFKNAVNTTLPATFFSYGSDSMALSSSKDSVNRAVSQMQLPSMNEVLQQAADASPGCTTEQCPMPARRSRRAKRSFGSNAHRFSSIHRHRLRHSTIAKHKREVTGAPQDLTAEERTITKGYSDGYLTAKIFAQYGMSKLGFDGQYIADSIKVLGPNVVAPGTETFYTIWFRRGLADAEALVSAAGSV